MFVIPAVDIKDGKCVQLVGGEPGTGFEYGDPVNAALEWEERGAEFLHLIDLDGAMDEGDNLEKIAEILANVNICVQVGGGIRTIEKACELLGIGADRVILGTAALEDPGLVEDLTEKASRGSVIVALDVKKGKVASEGWKNKTEMEFIDMAKMFEERGAGYILFTNIDVEGKMSGIDPEPIEKIVGSVDIPIIASGGVSSLDDVKRIKKAGASAVVIGTALYEGKLIFEEAVEVAL